MKKAFIIISLIFVLLLGSCGLPLRYTAVRGSGKLVTETRRVSGITSVELSGVGTLIIEQGDEESLEITAEDNIIGYLESRVNGSTLSLGVQDFIDLYPTEEIILNLKVKDLSSIETSGSGYVQMDTLETEFLKIDISGSGEAVIQSLNAETLDAEISGSGEMDISGSVDHQSLRISGSGTFNGKDLSSDSANVDISGSGSAVIWATDDLRLDLSGSGEVEYYGEPTLNTDISGSGSIRSLGSK